MSTAEAIRKYNPSAPEPVRREQFRLVLDSFERDLQRAERQTQPKRRQSH